MQLRVFDSPTNTSFKEKFFFFWTPKCAKEFAFPFVND
jgi:hypothetical protein